MTPRPRKATLLKIASFRRSKELRYDSGKSLVGPMRATGRKACSRFAMSRPDLRSPAERGSRAAAGAWRLAVAWRGARKPHRFPENSHRSSGARGEPATSDSNGSRERLVTLRGHAPSGANCPARGPLRCALVNRTGPSITQACPNRKLFDDLNQSSDDVSYEPNGRAGEGEVTRCSTNTTPAHKAI